MPSITYTPVATQEQPAPGSNPLDEQRFLYKLDKKLAIWTTLNIFVSLLAIFVLSSTRFHSQHPQTHETMTTGIKSTDSLLPPQNFFPKFPTSTMVFANYSYFQDDGPRGDELWQEMLPQGGGALRIPHPRRFDMPPSALLANDSEASEAYATSVTHQLHCLAMVRDVVVSSITGRERKTDGSADRHIVHCLDYIRQAIICNGDTTLEEFKAVLDGEGHAISYYIDGMGTTHQCRDWNAIKEFLVQNRFLGAEESEHHHGL